MKMRLYIKFKNCEELKINCKDCNEFYTADMLLADIFIIKGEIEEIVCETTLRSSDILYMIQTIDKIENN